MGKKATFRNMQTVFFFLRQGYKMRLVWWKKGKYVYFDEKDKRFKMNTGEDFSLNVEDESKTLIWGIYRG